MSSTGAETNQLVNVYREDGAMAVLMNNVSTDPTEPGGGPAVPDIQDPCKDLIELRLEKVWKGDKPEDRPKEVVFQITRSYEVDGETITDETFKAEVSLTVKDAITEDVWERDPFWTRVYRIPCGRRWKALLLYLSYYRSQVRWL